RHLLRPLGGGPLSFLTLRVSPTVRVQRFGHPFRELRRKHCGSGKLMDASALKDTIPENARAALEPTAQGAQLRRRAIAVGGFGLLVLGFLVVIGLGKLIAFLLFLALGAGVAFVVGRTLRRRGGTIRQAAGAVQSAAGTAARRPVTSARTRTAERRERSPRRNHGKEAGRLNARGV